MLHTPEDFLNAIEADSADRTRRLVFADWLDEHDDPRGELIRVEEEMRELPVFSDRFWELKPRRNALRVQAGPEWCGRMRYGTECEPVFRHGIPDGWRERWRLIREFTERWHRIPMPDVGGRQAEIAEAETRLGRKLPPSVREWFAFSHDVSSEGASRLSSYPLWMEDFGPRSGVSLLTAFSGSASFGLVVRYADFARQDPPIVGVDPDAEDEPDTEGNPGGTEDENTVSQLALWYVTQASSGQNQDQFYLPEPEYSRFRGEVEAAFPISARSGRVSFHEMGDILVAFGLPSFGGGPVFWVKRAADVALESLPAILKDVRRRAFGGDIPF